MLVLGHRGASATHPENTITAFRAALAAGAAGVELDVRRSADGALVVRHDAHTQHAEYLDVLHGPHHELREMNPSDFAHHLSRRARGLPFWFSLATYGTSAYARAVDTTLEVARGAAALIRQSNHVELIMEPELSIVMFRRLGWTPAQYQSWSDKALLSGDAFVVPTSWNGETVLRLCFVNPLTTVTHVAEILDSLR